MRSTSHLGICLLLLLCLATGVGCSLFVPDASDLDTLIERYGDLPDGTFVVDSRGRNFEERFEGCTGYGPPRIGTALHVIKMLDTLRIESRVVVGTLYTLDLSEVQAPKEIGANFYMDNLDSESGTLQILEQTDQFVVGVFSFRMNATGPEVLIPRSVRMEGGFHLRFRDIFGEEPCSIETGSP